MSLSNDEAEVGLLGLLSVGEGSLERGIVGDVDLARGASIAEADRALGAMQTHGERENALEVGLAGALLDGGLDGSERLVVPVALGGLDGAVNNVLNEELQWSQLTRTGEN